MAQAAAAGGSAINEVVLASVFTLLRVLSASLSRGNPEGFRLIALPGSSRSGS